MEIAERDAANAVIHLYRGELGRMTLYRIRLDTSTNWAVGTSAAMVSYALGAPNAPHEVFVLVVLLDLVFLTMESRRFRNFEMIRQRVRILENGFYGDVLRTEGRDDGWEKRVMKTLENPDYPITFAQALSVRLRRNYLWLLLAVAGGWLFKLSTAGPTLVEAAAVGPISGSIVLGAIGLLFVPLMALALVHRPAEVG